VLHGAGESTYEGNFSFSSLNKSELIFNQDFK